MKTLDEHNDKIAEKKTLAAERKKAQEDADAYEMQFISERFPNPDDETLETRSKIMSKEYVKAGIACNGCNTELAEDPSLVYFDEPPRVKVLCPGCGWKGFKNL